MFMVPRHRVDTSKEVRPSPMVRYRMVVSLELLGGPPVRDGSVVLMTCSTLRSDRHGCTVRFHGT
ncbi:hypothetical protein CCE02nite_35270 [Cellulosimicrobium cellulans]|uniref:Uncharacterized protein n=1 Tax=Cellulosimicrobium cellulans TaxID=1710 RepID=A0A4Y4E7P8_CELCE|nr:hypothetical protein CCE02nite_35270 [Cellulosimicrobium cellulans]